MSVVDDELEQLATADQGDAGMRVIIVLDEIHQRMLLERDAAGLRRLGRMSDDELVQLARSEIDTWSSS